MRRRFPISLACIAISGLAHAEPGAPSSVPVPAPAVAPSAPSVASPPATIRVIRSWEEALSLAETRSSDLRIAFDEIEQAAGQTRVALAQALPSIVGQGSYVHSSVSSSIPQVLPSGTAVYGSPNYLEGNLQISQPLIAIQAWNAVGAARAAEASARLALDDSKRTTAINLATVILGVMTAERAAEVDRAALDRALELDALARTRARIGGATEVDVARARGNVDAAQNALIWANESLRQAREALGFGLGLNEPVGVAPDTRLNGIAEPHRCPTPSALDERPDVASARLRVEAADKNARGAKEAFLPTLIATANLNTGTYSAPGLPSAFWDIQAILTVPIWNGGAQYGVLRATRAAADEAAQRLAATERVAGLQMIQAERAVAVAGDVLASAFDERAQAQTVAHITESAYRDGLGTTFDLVSSAASLRQAELNLTLREYAVVKAKIVAALTRPGCVF